MENIMAAINGMRGTGEFDTDFRPKNYRELFTLLEPNGNAPLNAMLAMGSSSSTNDPEYKNFRDALPERRVTVHATDGSAAATDTGMTIIGDDNKFVVPGTILVNSGTGEVMRVTTATAGTVTIGGEEVVKNDLVTVRNVGSSTTSNTSDNDVLFIAGHAAAEGSSTPTPVSFDASVEFNYTQIFRTAFSVSNTLNATYLRTGNKEDEQRTKALKLHMSDIERAMIFGKRSETDGGTSAPLRTTGGLISNITTKKDGIADYSNGVITEAEFDQLLIEEIFKYGSNQKIAFVGPRVAGLLQQIGKNRFQPTQVQGTYGVNLTRYQTFAGDLLVHLHPQFRQLSHMNSSMLVVDFPDLEYRHLDGRDTQLLENRQNNDEDLVKHEYLSECGLEMKQDLTHAYITNWTALSA